MMLDRLSDFKEHIDLNPAYYTLEMQVKIEIFYFKNYRIEFGMGRKDGYMHEINSTLYPLLIRFLNKKISKTYFTKEEIGGVITLDAPDSTWELKINRIEDTTDIRPKTIGEEYDLKITTKNELFFDVLYAEIFSGKEFPESTQESSYGPWYYSKSAAELKGKGREKIEKEELDNFIEFYNFVKTLRKIKNNEHETLMWDKCHVEYDGGSKFLTYEETLKLIKEEIPPEDIIVVDVDGNLLKTYKYRITFLYYKGDKERVKNRLKELEKLEKEKEDEKVIMAEKTKDENDIIYSVRTNKGREITFKVEYEKDYWDDNPAENRIIENGVFLYESEFTEKEKKELIKLFKRSCPEWERDEEDNLEEIFNSFIYWFITEKRKNNI